MNKICIKNLTKKFGNIIAINKLNLELEAGKIYGLIGRNGAGKTTLMKMMANQLLPTQGRISIDDDALIENKDAMKKIFLARDQEMNFSSYKPKMIFQMAGDVYENWDREYADSLVKKFNLPVDRKYGRLSKGMKTVAGLIIGLASKTAITMFDEPYSGLDPVAKQFFYEQLQEQYINNRRTIIISSHVINELESLLEEVIIINNGSIILHDSLENIREKSIIISGDEYIVRKYSANMKLLKTEKLGQHTRVYAYGRISQQEKENMYKEGLKISSMSLESFFVAMHFNSDGGYKNE